MHGIKFCAHLFERSLLRRLFAFFLREWMRRGRIVNTEMGIRMHSLFFHDAVVARPDISPRTVISRSHVRDIIFIKSLFLFAGSEFLAVLHFPCLIPFNYYRPLLLSPSVLSTVGRCPLNFFNYGFYQRSSYNVAVNVRFKKHLLRGPHVRDENAITKVNTVPLHL